MIMKTLQRLVSICLFVTLVVVLSGFTSGDNNGAFVDKDWWCGVYDGNGALHWVNDGTIEVIKSNGNTKVTCKAKNLPNDQGKAVIFKGFKCGTWLGPTNLSKNTVSASGNVTLTCRIIHAK